MEQPSKNNQLQSKEKAFSYEKAFLYFPLNLSFNPTVQLSIQNTTPIRHFWKNFRQISPNAMGHQSYNNLTSQSRNII